MPKGKYVFNMDYADLTKDELFTKIIEYCKKYPTFPTLDAKRGLKLTIINITEKDILMQRSEAGKTKVTFEEIKTVLKLLQENKYINTVILKANGLEGHNQTPLISLLIASDICY